MITPRRLASVSVVLLAVACAVPSAPTTSDGVIGSSGAAITGGTADTANPHTAVVALLSPASGGYGQCSGTIVQVAGGVASVLTAAHCCNGTEGAAPTIVVVSNSYASSVSQISVSSPAAPAYAVIASSIKWDTNYNGDSANPIDDFCMLQFKAPAGTASIPVATGSDGLAVGSKVDYVGFGVTTDNPNDNNTIRNIATNVPINTAVTANTFSYTESSTVGNGGPCSGDSGGPALIPPGVAQSQQKVVGTTSYGGQTCAAQGSTGVDMRVTSQTGTAGFITTYLNGGTTTGDSGTSPPPTDAGSGGVPTTCAEVNTTIGCCEGTTNYYCKTATSTTVSQLACTGGKVCGWDTAKGYYACVAAPGGADPTGTNPLACGGTSTTTTDAGSDTGTTTTGDSGTTTGDSGTTTTGDGSTGTTDGATTGGDSGTVVIGADSGTGIGTDSGGVILPPTTDSGLRSADGAVTTGSDSGTGGSGVTVGSQGGCSVASRGESPSWLLIGIAMAAVGGRRRRARKAS